MSQAARRHPYLTLAVLVAGLAASAWLWFALRPAAADTPGPASINVSTVLINAPQSGGSVYVTGSVNGSYSGGSSGNMQVWGRSVTQDNLLRDGQAQWYALNSTANAAGTPASFYGYVQAAYGDLIEVKASNWYYSI
jgi:hypothetical protein